MKFYKFLCLSFVGLVGQMLQVFAEEGPEFIAAKLLQNEHKAWVEFEYYDLWRFPFVFEAVFEGTGPEKKFFLCIQLDWKSYESVVCFEPYEREPTIEKLLGQFSDTDRQKLATLCFLLTQKSDEISTILNVKDADGLGDAFVKRQSDFQVFGEMCTKYIAKSNEHEEISTKLLTHINDDGSGTLVAKAQSKIAAFQTNDVSVKKILVDRASLTKSKKLPYLNAEVVIDIVSREAISTEPFGEETLFFDVDFDGDMELLLFPASTRSSYFPEQNDVAVFEVGPNLELQAQFSIIESQQFKGASKIKSNLGLPDFKSGWLQNVEVADFDNDGQLDLFFSGHGREWPSANILSGDDQGNDELFRKAQELYKSWPGDFSRILMSNSGNPKVVRINERPFFAHSAKVGDLNGDSKLDVVSLNIGEPRGYDRTNIFLGNGNGRFDLLNAPNDAAVEWKSHKLRNNLNTYFGVSTVEVADFNNDGVEEILIGGSGLDQVKENFILVSYDQGKFKVDGAVIIDTDQINALSGRSSKIQNISIDKLNIADLDNDGDVDFVAKLFDHEIDDYLATVAFYNSNRTFNQVVVDTNELDEVNGQVGGNGPKFIDINQDGLADIVKDGWLGASNGDENFFLTQIHLNLGEELGFIKLSDLIGAGFYLGIENLDVGSSLFVPRHGTTPILAYAGGYKRVLSFSGAPKTYGAKELLLLRITGLPTANEISEICKSTNLAFCNFKKFSSHTPNILKIQEHLLKHCPDLGVGWVDGFDGPSTRKAIANLAKSHGIADEQLKTKTFHRIVFGPPDGSIKCD